MSQPLIAARKVPVRAREARPDTAGRPELQVVVPPAVRRVRLPLPVACVLLLSLGLFGLLMTNIAIAGDAYRLTDLQVTSQGLADQQQAAQESLAARSAPQALASRAAELGMVPAPAPVHLTADGAVGTPTAAPTPTAGPTAEPAPAAPGA
ncbi:cell division protein FtsL, partial [Kineococcus indalonis]|uniref:cell division protein FtsL n=1 Tax=Kineococcus indalonis TaxID=2696566 RepID=UPI001411B918